MFSAEMDQWGYCRLLFLLHVNRRNKNPTRGGYNNIKLFCFLCSTTDYGWSIYDGRVPGIIGVLVVDVV